MFPFPKMFLSYNSSLHAFGEESDTLHQKKFVQSEHNCPPKKCVKCWPDMLSSFSKVGVYHLVTALSVRTYPK